MNGFQIRYQGSEEIDNIKYFIRTKTHDAARTIKQLDDFNIVMENNRQVIFFHPQDDVEGVLNFERVALLTNDKPFSKTSVPRFLEMNKITKKYAIYYIRDFDKNAVLESDEVLSQE